MQAPMNRGIILAPCLSPPANDRKRGRVEILECETIVETALTAQPRLYTVPPAVIGSRKTHDQLPTGIKTRQTHCGHDRFGTTHMKGHFIQVRHGFEQCDVLGYDRMQRPQHRTETFDALQTLGHPLLVALKSRHVDAICATHIQGPMPIKVM
jgi:hypothetical protein